MEHLLELFKSLYSVEGLKYLVSTGGPWLLAAIIFSETGLLVGFFLPGDSLLITAGIFTATDGLGGPPLLDLSTLLFLLTASAIVGDQVGYFLGSRAGPHIFNRKDTFFFKKKHVHAAAHFYEKHGARALILARFVPIFRTFVPFVAGVVHMNYKNFIKYNVWGGVFWIVSMLLLGHFLGTTPLANHLHRIILIVIFVSVLPLVVTYLKSVWKNSKGL